VQRGIGNPFPIQEGEGVTFPGIEILQQPSGRPYVVLHGGAAEKAAELGIKAWHLSITHTGDLAIASAIAERG